MSYDKKIFKLICENVFLIWYVLVNLDLFLCMIFLWCYWYIKYWLGLFCFILSLSNLLVYVKGFDCFKEIKMMLIELYFIWKK